MVKVDILFGLLVEAHEQLVALFGLGVFEEFDPSHVVCVLHVFEDSLNLVSAILVLNVVGISLNMATNFSDEGVPSTLKHQANTEVWIILLFLKACFRQPILESDVALLLATQLFAHDLEQTDLAHDQLFLVHQVLLEVFVFLKNSFESLRDLLASLHDLLLEHFIFDPGILEPEQERVFLVDALQFFVLDLVEYKRIILIATG